tara:strand:+ start:584 stop:976 length:393 start_codon:yes stop_codon:yes gene_type:complete
MNRVDEQAYKLVLEKEDASIDLIASDNDKLRQSIFDMKHMGENKLVLSHDVSQLNPIDKLEVLKLVRDFKTFTKDDDPYGEHDFGSFNFKDISYFWKIDYYDNDLKFHSEDKLNAEKTIKVLTVLRASEY